MQEMWESYMDLVVFQFESYFPSIVNFIQYSKIALNSGEKNVVLVP